jgi:peptidylprolyl isomerase
MTTKTVKKGDVVSIEYTGTLETGEVFDSSKGREPLEFEVGSGSVIKGFDNGVLDMKIGDEKEIKINPDEGYGQRSEAYVKDLPRKSVPESLELKKGMILIFKREDGLRMPATVNEIKPDTVKVDFNHPLAGKKLTFKVKLVAIK